MARYFLYNIIFNVYLNFAFCRRFLEKSIHIIPQNNYLTDGGRLRFTVDNTVYRLMLIKLLRDIFYEG